MEVVVDGSYCWMVEVQVVEVDEVEEPRVRCG